MENILSFIQQYDKLLEILTFIFMAIFSILIYKKTGDISIIKEVFRDMKYKTENTLPTTQGQSFSNYKEVYRLNKATGQLEKTQEVLDIREIVKSSLCTALDSILDRFLPTANGDTEDIAIINAMQDDLDTMQENFNIIEDIKLRYKLADDLSPMQVFDELAKIKSNVDATIKEKQKNVETEEKPNA